MSRMVAYYASHKSEHDARVRSWRDRNPDKVRRYRRADKFRRYGLTVAAYDALVASQGNACAICRASFTETQPCVDHDHATGKVRGVLCGLCNSTLGHAKDSPEILEAGAAYLRRNGR